MESIMINNVVSLVKIKLECYKVMGKNSNLSIVEVVWLMDLVMFGLNML